MIRFLNSSVCSRLRSGSRPLVYHSFCAPAPFSSVPTQPAFTSSPSFSSATPHEKDSIPPGSLFNDSSALPHSPETHPNASSTSSTTSTSSTSSSSSDNSSSTSSSPQDPYEILHSILPALTQDQFGEFCLLFPTLSPTKGKVEVGLDASGNPFVINQKGAASAQKLVALIQKFKKEVEQLHPTLVSKFPLIVCKNPEICRMKSLKKSFERIEEMFGSESLLHIVSTYPRILVLAVVASGHTPTSPTKLEEKMASLSEGLGEDEALELIRKDPFILSKNAGRTTVTRVDMLENILNMSREQVVRVICAIPELLYSRQNRLERLRIPSLPPVFGSEASALPQSKGDEGAIIDAEVSPAYVAAVTELFRLNDAQMQARGGLPPVTPSSAPLPASKGPKNAAKGAKKQTEKIKGERKNVILYPEEEVVSAPETASSLPSSSSLPSHLDNSSKFQSQVSFADMLATSSSSSSSSPPYSSSSLPYSLPSQHDQKPSTPSESENLETGKLSKNAKRAKKREQPPQDEKPKEFYTPVLPARSNKENLQTFAWVPADTAHNRLVRIARNEKIRAEEEKQRKEAQRDDEILGILSDPSLAEPEKEGRKSKAVSATGARSLKEPKRGKFDPALWKQDEIGEANDQENTENKAPVRAPRLPKHRGKRKPTLPPWWTKPRREGGNNRLLRGAARKAAKEKRLAQNPRKKTIRRYWSPS